MENRPDITDLGYYLNRTFTRLVYELDCGLHAAGIPLNHSQFSILQILARSHSGVMSQREMSLKLGKDPAAISRTVIYLEKQGFISRYPVNGSKNGVSLTDKAKELQPRIEQIIRNVTTAACHGMSEKEINAGLSFLIKILDLPHHG